VNESHIKNYIIKKLWLLLLSIYLVYNKIIIIIIIIHTMKYSYIWKYKRLITFNKKKLNKKKSKINYIIKNKIIFSTKI